MAARKYGVPIDLTQNEVRNAVAQNLASAPGTPAIGQFYYDTVAGRFIFRGASAWIDPTARANHSGTQLSATISDLASTVQAYKLNQFAVPNANIPMGGFTFTGLATPNAAGQAAEYSWVLGQVQAAAAGIDNKPSVVAVATSNVASLSGLQTIDGVTLTAGQRVLLVAQTTATQNGVYLAAAGAWARDTDTITPQAFWFVEQGTTNTGTQWKVSTSGTITLGSTALAISQYGAGATYAAGNGLSLNSNAFAVVAATNGGLLSAAGGVSVVLQTNPGLVLGGTGLAVQLQASSGLALAASGLAIDPAIVTRKYNVNIGDGSATSYAVTHNLNTLDCMIQVYEISTGATVEVDTVRTSVNVATINFTNAPSANQYRVVVQG